MNQFLIQADARRLPLADRSVHCVVTSPPYHGLRDYGVAGQIGLEETPDAFVAEMVKVFREVKRVLRDDGVAWVNMGDGYSPGKQLMGMPWRLAFALQDDGWILRSDVIWSKPNPMPESVTDRPTKSHEYLFLLSKQEKYFFDAEAVRENTSGNAHARGKNGAAAVHPKSIDQIPGQNRANASFLATMAKLPDESGRNLRTVWPIATEAYPGAHFATFPRKLVEPCIKAGTSERGCCPECGKGWERVVERQRGSVGILSPKNADAFSDGVFHDGATSSGLNGPGWRKRPPPSSETIGWRPACNHGHDPVPCTVLDIFCGSGTTLVVADALGRRSIGCDLSPEYLRLARHRLTRPHARVPRPEREEFHPLFGGLED